MILVLKNAMGSKQIHVHDSAYYKLKAFRNNNDIKSFTDAVNILLKHYYRWHIPEQTSYTEYDVQAEVTSVTIK